MNMMQCEVNMHDSKVIHPREVERQDCILQLLNKLRFEQTQLKLSNKTQKIMDSCNFFPMKIAN